MPKPKCNFESELDKAIQKYGSEILDEMKDSFFSREALIERVLLGLIPEDIWDKSAAHLVQQRLATATKALFGKGSDRRADAKDDQHALLWMADQHYCDLQKVNGARNPRSIHSLATQVSKRYLLHLQDAARDRLRRKFTRQRSELMSAMGERQEAIGWLRRHALEDMKTILESFGVGFYSDN